MPSQKEDAGWDTVTSRYTHYCVDQRVCAQFLVHHGADSMAHRHRDAFCKVGLAHAAQTKADKDFLAQCEERKKGKLRAGGREKHSVLALMEYWRWYGCWW